MKVVNSRTFKSGNSEAVRLPKAIGFGLGTEIVIERVGDIVTIKPKPELSWRKRFEAFRTRPNPSRGWTRLPVDIPDRVRFGDA